jgi:hypothetical protein
MISSLLFLPIFRRAQTLKVSLAVLASLGGSQLSACGAPASNCDEGAKCIGMVTAEEHGDARPERDSGQYAAKDAATQAHADAATLTPAAEAGQTTTNAEISRGGANVDAGIGRSNVRDTTLGAMSDGGADSELTSSEVDTSTPSGPSDSSSSSATTTNPRPRLLAEIGQPCVVGGDCRSGLCFSERDSTGAAGPWVGGACYDDCTSLGKCPEGSACLSVDEVAYCLPACETHANCRDDYACYPDEPSICLPDCHLLPDGCTLGYVCTDEGACEPEPDIECCDPSDPCGFAEDSVCDCGGEFAWDAVDCADFCTPQEVRCVQNTPETCDEYGYWSVGTACDEQACVNAECVGVCAPGARQCEEGSVRQCDEVGQWGAASECEWGCLPEEGCAESVYECTNVCLVTTCDVLTGCECTSSVRSCLARSCVVDADCGTRGYCDQTGDEFVCRARETCTETTCEHGGTCVQEGLGISCACVDGYAGPRCETLQQCVAGEVPCDDGVCISEERLCDQAADCAGGEDEVNCPMACEPDMFTCDDGECIDGTWQCDGLEDCASAEDEVDCIAGCGPGAFTCVDDECIDVSWICDGFEDCSGGEDEVDCTPRTLPDGGAGQGWVCDPYFYAALDGCDCECGLWDPDCDVVGETLFNCDEDYVCVRPGVCSLP